MDPGSRDPGSRSRSRARGLPRVCSMRLSARVAARAFGWAACADTRRSRVSRSLSRSLIHVTGGTERSAIGGPGGAENARHLDVPGVRRVRAVAAVAVRGTGRGGGRAGRRRRAPRVRPLHGPRTADEAAGGWACGGRSSRRVRREVVAAAAARGRRTLSGPVLGAGRLAASGSGGRRVAVAHRRRRSSIFDARAVSARLRHRRLRGDVVADANLGRGRPTRWCALTPGRSLDVRRSRHVAARVSRRAATRPDRHLPHTKTRRQTRM